MSAPPFVDEVPSALRSLASGRTLWSTKGEGRYVADWNKYVRKTATVAQAAATEFDVIVVGGGTAGCVLASRLSEDPSIRVLLLEAGQSSKNVTGSTVPAGFTILLHRKHDYNLWTVPQVHAGGRSKYWPRGKLLGGCSAINAMIFHCGSPSDYDEWAEVQRGAPGSDEWSYKNLQTYFRKFEKYDPRKAGFGVDPALHGTDGKVIVGFNGHQAPLNDSFIGACEELGIMRTDDLNTHKGTLGVAKTMSYIDSKGVRVTAERAYLTDDVLARPNLTVAVNAHVKRILFDDVDGVKRAVGVEFGNTSKETFRVLARKEVVLSAGAVHTPQILMLSGIGPADHLQSLGIPVVIDLPGVGSNLKDHIVVDLAYMDKTKTALSFLLPATVSMVPAALKALFRYVTSGTGPLTTNLAETVAFIRTDDEKLFPADTYPNASAPEDTSSGEASPDLEFFFSPVGYKHHNASKPPNVGHYSFMTHAVLLRPKSTGTIRLRSADPTAPPVIDPNYLADENDVKTLIRGIRLLDKIAHTNSLRVVIDPAGDTHPELHHNLEQYSDDQLENMIREQVETLYHPVCTARMAPLEEGGVVDTALRVYGVPNLRVVDASVFPTIVSGHTSAPVLAVAEKAADMLKVAISV